MTPWVDALGLPSTTIFTSFPRYLEILATPIAAPIQSKSEFLCPQTYTFSLFSINSLKAWAIALALTLLIFSRPALDPPKKSYFLSFFTTAWSPPLPKAISSAELPALYLSSSVSSE